MPAKGAPLVVRPFTLNLRRLIMADIVKPTLTAILEGMHQEDACVQENRNKYLAALGQLALVVHEGVAAAELLAHAAYQNSLKSTPEEKKVLGAPAAAALTDILNALKLAREGLNAAISTCFTAPSWSYFASKFAINVMVAEQKYCEKRSTEAEALAKTWQKALEDYLKLYPKDAPPAVPPVAPPPPEVNHHD